MEKYSTKETNMNKVHFHKLIGIKTVNTFCFVRLFFFVCTQVYSTKKKEKKNYTY